MVRGARNINEAKKIIQAQKENAKKGVVDINIISPRGWVSQDNIEKIIKEQNIKKNTYDEYER